MTLSLMKYSIFNQHVIKSPSSLAIIREPLEDRVKNAFAQYTVAANQEKQELINQANNVDATNPAELIQLQNRVGNYTLAMNMMNTLTHKSVSAIDTVLKAQ